MVPPVRLTEDKSIDEKIMVWLRIPAGQKVQVQWLANENRYTLRFPPQTVTDRIDGGENQKQAMFTVNGITDVRGARVGADGSTLWHVYEPVPGKSSGWLAAMNGWHRASGRQSRRGQADQTVLSGGPAKAKQEMAVFRRLNRCGACHQPDRPVPTTAASDVTPRLRLTRMVSISPSRC